MSWLKIDDLFEEHAKVEPLSDAAHRLWFRCACWCKKPANEHLNGLVPLRKVIDFCGGGKARALKLAKELVDAKGDPAFGKQFGLWEPRDGGWQFHDWAVYQPSKDSPPQPPPPDSADARSASARAAGLASAEARRQKNGTAQPSRTPSERHTERHTERPSNDSRTHSNPNVSNGFEPNAEPPDPDPIPDPTEARSQDLSGDLASGVKSASSFEEITPLQKKYELAQRNPGAWAMNDGHKAPEFRAVWFAWCKPLGITEGPVVGRSIDNDLLVIIDAFAAGRTLEQLLLVGKIAETDSFIAGVRGKAGPSIYSNVVIRRLLAEKSQAPASGEDLGDYGKAADWA